jgi:hypothetical protein
MILSASRSNFNRLDTGLRRYDDLMDNLGLILDTLSFVEQFGTFVTTLRL